MKKCQFHPICHVISVELFFFQKVGAPWVEVHVLKVVSEVNMSQNFYYNSLALNSLMEFIQWMLLCILVIG